MIVLAIETSCDETAMALADIQERLPRSARNDGLPQVKVLKSVVASQIQVHAPFGGVVPTLAKREHLKNLPVMWKQFLKHPLVKNKKIDLLTVTVGPGLEPALWTGIVFAKEIHEKYFDKKIPLVGANHLQGHLYSFLLSKGMDDRYGSSYRTASASDGRKPKPADDTGINTHTDNLFPMISLIVSGGHTILGVLKNLNTFKKLGETKDDAVGECFDKVARLLELPYPGGPEIEKTSRKGNKDAVFFPSPMIHQKNYDFSYAGLKTAVLYYMRDKVKGKRIKVQEKADIAAGFQEAAFKVLVKKTERAVGEFKAQSVSIGGGVAASKELRKMLNHEVRLPQTEAELPNPVKLLVPPFEYCMDNAVMIAVAGYMEHAQGRKYKLEAQGNLSV
jgi:N6-L-threonylcarbamoyladenine synthase